MTRSGMSTVNVVETMWMGESLAEKSPISYCVATLATISHLIINYQGCLEEEVLTIIDSVWLQWFKPQASIVPR